MNAQKAVVGLSLLLSLVPRLARADSTEAAMGMWINLFLIVGGLFLLIGVIALMSFGLRTASRRQRRQDAERRADANADSSRDS